MLLQSPKYRHSLAAFVAIAVALASVAGWVALELRHHAALGALAGQSFAFVCALVSPPLPALGAAMLPAALAIMAPCLLQLSLVLVTATAGLAATSGTALVRPGIVFALGFLGVYSLAALVIGLGGWVLAPVAFVIKAVGGLVIALLGLAVLRVLPGRALSSCRGPRWLVLTGRASLRKPLGAGAAFAIYCVGCCGPYLSGLALLGAGSGNALAGTGLVLVFALLMGGLLLLPMLAMQASRRLAGLLQRHGPRLAPIAGTTLVALGVAIALEPLAVWLLLPRA